MLIDVVTRMCLTALTRIRKALENRTNMEDDRVAILEAQLSQAKLIAEESDKKYEEVNMTPCFQLPLLVKGLDMTSSSYVTNKFWHLLQNFSRISKYYWDNGTFNLVHSMQPCCK